MTTQQLASLDVAPDRVTKEVINDYAIAIIDNVLEGNVNAMDVALKFKFMEDLMDKLKERLRPLVLDELNKYAKGEDIVRYNGQFKAMEAGTRYDFTACNDPEWNDLSEQIAALTTQRKEREKFLRALTRPTTICDDRTGEMIEVNPPTRSSTSTFSITWHK